MEKKRYKFHLNTSTFCFLCLGEIANQENYIGFDNKSDESNIILKSNKVVSLQKLFNYLKIDLSQVKSLSSKSKSIINKTDVRVTLCSECGMAVEQFSELCKAMDLIVMKLEYSLETIGRKLRNVQNDPTFPEKYKSRIKECEDVQAQKHSKVVKELRNEIRSNCDAMTPKFQPKVRLTRERIVHKEQQQITSGSLQNVKKEPSFDVPDISQYSTQSQYEDSFGSDYNEDFDSSLQNDCSSNEVENETLESKQDSFNEIILSFPVPSSSPTITNCAPVTEKQKAVQSCNRDRVKKWVKNIKTGTFDCVICKKPFMHNHSVAQHYETVHLGKRYRCEQCRKTYSQKGHLTFHQKTCKQTLQNRLARNKAFQNDPNRKFCCKTCNKVFLSKSYLQNHNKAVHLNERNYVCKICGKSFKFLCTLKGHIKSIHLGEKFCCKFCNKPFDSQGGQSLHEVKCRANIIKTETNS